MYLYLLLSVLLKTFHDLVIRGIEFEALLSDHYSPSLGNKSHSSKQCSDLFRLFMVETHSILPCSLQSTSFIQSSKACIIQCLYLNVLCSLQITPNASETNSKELLCGEFGLFKEPPAFHTPFGAISLERKLSL